MENALIIARCSTSEVRQDVSRQTEELTGKYSSQFKIVKSFSYYMSGTTNDSTNAEILEYAVSAGVSFLLVSEVSRISRRVSSVLQFVETCNKLGISIIIDNYNLRTLNNDKTINTIVQMMLSIGASFAQMELTQTKTRLDSGRQKYIRDGGKLGRKVGSAKDTKKLLSDHADIVKFVRQGQSVRNIMKLTCKSSATIQKVKKLTALKEVALS
ncbi:MAG: recombinase family protein [Flavobacterium sp.]|nr:MAG: recombinase family protein [Flavobacterium sp.]